MQALQAINQDDSVRLQAELAKVGSSRLATVLNEVIINYSSLIDYEWLGPVIIKNALQKIFFLQGVDLFKNN